MRLIPLLAFIALIPAGLAVPHLDAAARPPLYTSNPPIDQPSAAGPHNGASSPSDRSPADTTEAWRSATLRGWHRDVRTAVRDRRHAYGGLFFDRGVIRRLTPAMDHEYDMDLLTYGFTPSDDAEWYRGAHGVRTFMGSIHKSRFATQTRFRHEVAIAGRHAVLLDAMQQEDLAAQRFFIEIGYHYSLGTQHHIGFSQTVAAYKPDLDFALFYSFESPNLGLIRAELGLLDAANNLIFDRLGVDPVLEDTIRSYSRKPRIFDVSWRSPVWAGFRSEVMVGIQPTSKAMVQSQQTSDLQFRWNERLHYAAGLLEYRNRLLTSGLLYRHTFGDIARHSEKEARFETAYSAAQTSHAVTVYFLAPVWRLRTGLWLTAEGYVDRQIGTAFDEASIHGTMNYRERRLTLHARLEHVPQRGIRAGLDYFVDHRVFMEGSDLMNAYLRFLPWSPNGRLAMNAGYQFSENAYLVIGGAYDVGGDPFYGDDRGSVRYDGGFGRVVITW